MQIHRKFDILIPAGVGVNLVCNRNHIENTMWL